jgi:hypothetical protein
LFKELGLQQAQEKTIPPTTCLTWIGIDFNTLEMSMKVPQRVLSETLALVNTWLHKTCATRHQLQVLLGKLFHVAKCAKPAQLFVNRMLELLRVAPQNGYIQLTMEFKRDLNWFVSFLPLFNGIHLIQVRRPGAIVYIDACLTGVGGVAPPQYYHSQLPPNLIEESHPIAHVEMLNVLVAVFLWATLWTGYTVEIHCDNTNTINTLLHGRARDPFLLAVARQIWFISACFDIEFRPVHVPGVHMQIPDRLSRYHTSPAIREWVHAWSRQHDMKQVEVPDKAFEIPDFI